ncbi:MAG: NAD(P)-dependent oxidoreductase [Desulfitobacterium hafniense]|nr:NAD(P)-dependent oxidoreductase [Desulfitobacterium hafniense]
MERIGFIGLGTMGLPMAENLLKAGYSLVVFNRTSDKSEKLRVLGAQIAACPADVTRMSDVVFTMLSNDAVVEEVFLGKEGIKYGVKSGQIIVDSSTISPKTSRKLAEELGSLGAEVLDAPVMGTEQQAIEGNLTFMVGGKKENFEKVLPLLSSMGKNSYHMGGSGNGSFTKLANNTMGAINLLAFTEGIIMATKVGIDPELFIKVISGGARSGMVDYKGEKIIKRDFQPNFTTALMHKDLSLAQQLASENQIPMPVLSLVREMLQMAIAQGYAHEDVCSVVKCYEQWAGVEAGKIH